jgi:NitT/TauT family transport system permease protein
MRPHSSRALLAWQAVVFLLMLGAWELGSHLTDPTWTSRPTLVAVRLLELFKGEIYKHLAVTIGEIAAGVAIGGVLGSLGGLWLGTSRFLGALLRPMVVTLYNIPLVTLAPLFIVWFGFGMQSKVVLVAIAVFFVVFFNAFSGAQKVDEDILEGMHLMGATRYETFWKVVFPASMAWIVAGFKIAFPYALMAATTGEMLAARDGLGSLLAKSASLFDMTGVYTILLVLMVIGMLIAELAVRSENYLLRWRNAKQ